MNESMGPMGAIPLRPRKVGELLSAAFELYRLHWATLIAIVAVVTVPLSYLQSFLSYRLANQIEIRNGTVQNVPPDYWRTLAGTLLFAVASVVIVQVLTGAITRAAAGTLLGEDLTFEAAYRFGYARLGSILLVTILVGLSVAAGFILLIIPGFFVLVRLIASIPALVVEGERGRAALARSWGLVRGRGWPVFGTIIATGVISGFVNGALTAPFRSGWFGRGLAASVGSIIATHFTTLVWILVYLDLRVRKEQLDLDTLRRDLAASAP